MMITDTRISVALVAAALGLLAATVAHAAPCDTREDDGEYLDPPFTAQELRRAMAEGLEVIVRTESPVAGSFSRRMVVERAGADSVVLSEITLEEELRQSMPASTVDTTWDELRDHACFPASSTKRSRTMVQSPFGEMAAWRYEFDQGAVRLVLTFADELPGLPLSYQRFESGILVLSSQQAQRSDRLLVDEMPTAGEASPSGR